MIDYQKHINALKKCAKEHEHDRISTGHIIVSDLCKDTANLLEALEQPSVDAVSRQAVNDLVDELARAISDERLCMSRGRSTATIMRDILHLPSVTPKEKTGHWIDDMGLGYHVSICSNCNWRGHGDTCLIYKPKYCPNCGARMITNND